MQKDYYNTNYGENWYTFKAMSLLSAGVHRVYLPNAEELRFSLKSVPSGLEYYFEFSTPLYRATDEIHLPKDRGTNKFQLSRLADPLFIIFYLKYSTRRLLSFQFHKPVLFLDNVDSKSSRACFQARIKQTARKSSGHLSILTKQARGVAPGQQGALMPAQRGNRRGVLSTWEQRVMAVLDQSDADKYIHMPCFFWAEDVAGKGDEDVDKGEYTIFLLSRQEANRIGQNCRKAIKSLSKTQVSANPDSLEQCHLALLLLPSGDGLSTKPARGYMKTLFVDGSDLASVAIKYIPTQSESTTGTYALIFTAKNAQFFAMDIGGEVPSSHKDSIVKTFQSFLPCASPHRYPPIKYRDMLFRDALHWTFEQYLIGEESSLHLRLDDSFDLSDMSAFQENADDCATTIEHLLLAKMSHRQYENSFKSSEASNKQVLPMRRVPGADSKSESSSSSSWASKSKNAGNM